MSSDDANNEQLEEWRKWEQQTLAVRTGHERTAFNEHSEPIVPTSSFVFDSAAQAAARFSGDEPGYIYSRFTNPTVAAFQTRLAHMEGAEACIGTASGMSAVVATVLSFLKQGDHLIASKSMFGSTVNLFQKYLPRIGVELTWVTLEDMASWTDAMRPNTRMLFLETPTNPLTSIADIQAIADLAHQQDALLVVDNCVCSPALQRPLDFGADLVIHSATKYIDGQGRCVGGAVVGSDALINGELYAYMRSAGPSMSPFNAWVFLKGLETLNLRMDRHCDNADKIAKWLQEDSRVERVYHPSLDTHPQRELAGVQQSRAGPVLSFELGGGKDAAWQLIDKTRLFSITANFGDAKSTITHPATTTHGRMTEEDRALVGVKPSLVRLAAGLEHIDDLMTDLDRGLSQLG